MTATDIGTVVSPGVLLDRRTQDELEPPCEVPTIVCWCSLCGGQSTGFHECGQTAMVIMRGHCRACPAAVTLLLCADHAEDARQSALSDAPCPSCGSTEPYVVHEERL